MKLVITRDYEESAAQSARMINGVLAQKPDSVLGLATGTTPISVYKYMVRAFRRGQTDYSAVRSVNLDEYVGLLPTDKNSYRYFMEEHLFRQVNILPEHIYIPDGCGDVGEEIERLNRFLETSVIDVQLLSVGTNGHIGFNEPGEVFYDRYHQVELTQETRKSNSRLFERMDEVPTSAITMGIGGIMRARKIVFLATGQEKLRAMKAILEEGDVTPKIQGTILKFHPDCTIFLDRQLAEQIVPARDVEVVHCE